MSEQTMVSKESTTEIRIDDFDLVDALGKAAELARVPIDDIYMICQTAASGVSLVALGGLLDEAIRLSERTTMSFEESCNNILQSILSEPVPDPSIPEDPKPEDNISWLKRKIKHSKNPMEIKALNRQLNVALKERRKHGK